jgi:thiol-disulfide isomerase/thioredoxin
MNKRIVAVVIILAALIVGSVATYALTRPTTTEAAAPAPSTDQNAGVAPAAKGGGDYVEYSDTAIADAKGTILLFFHATWCPQCRSLDSDIVASGVPDDVTIIKVDYDSHQDLRQKYGVTMQTTFVKVDSAGGALSSFVAYSDPRLQSVIDEML